MNNGKVRIYELSKELNLDNRDILAICEQLNIAVKSHSSTITETEAEQIRAAAEKYAASQSSRSASARPNAPQSVESRKKTPLNIQKKQQILEIRRPITRSTAEKESSELRTPPQPPQSPQTATPAAKSLEPPRPTRPTPERSTPAVPESISAPEPAPVAQPVEPEALPKAAKTGAPSKPETTLQTPAARPASPARPVSTVSKPVLKRDKPATPEQSDNQQPSRDARGDKPQRPSINKRPGAPSKPGEAAPRSQQIVELRRPKPVQSEDGATEDGTTPVLRSRPVKPTAPDAIASPDLTLNKPTPPKRRTKVWEDEEEDTQEIPEKAAKLGKGKRRGQPKIQDDEDEDLDLLNEDEEGAVSSAQVSLSLARPAKPKGLPGQQQLRPVATAAPTQRRRNNFRDRRDRRNESDKPERPEIITLTGGLTVQELSNLLAVSPTEIITKLFMKGIAATITQMLDAGTATMVAEEYGILVEVGEKAAAARKVTEMIDAGDLDYLHRRPPVVTIMGHVDHGKTTLLDSIRKTKVAAGEAGGITQHIGAYHVDVEHNGEMQQVVFLDTPGHEAFTAMRARGARVTDVAILVVAADDGVRPQTAEAISHAKAAEVPIIVAINKVDKESAQPDRVKQELTEYNLVPEEWGGDTIMVPVSALTGENLDTLLEMILLVSEVEDLSANPDRPARGTVIEAHLDKAKGPVATLLIQNGTLRVGDVLVAGSALGKVRAMVNDRGQRVQVAGPSFAVEVLGLADVPAAGDEFQVYTEEKEARAVASDRADEQRTSRLLAAMSSRRVSLNTLSAKAQEGELKELNLVLKADVQGSIEAILGALSQLPQNEVQVRVLFSAPGEISETDVDLAAASDAVIIGFNTTLAPGARQAADRAGVDVRDYNIIYNLLDDVQGAMEGLLEPELVEEGLGQAEVRAVFPVGRGAVAGCYVQSGKLVRNCKVRVHRGGKLMHSGNLDSLKRMREDAREVNFGYECGIGLDDFKDWAEGDIVEAYKMVTKRRTLAR
ncbi:translation initiation factor IF-2 [Leptolyngbya sp. NIES-2104]|uniref:translation initiation factor IF-2 n=1 Tax=Leptolyngbya sp. NIES-2104 TaxID=1552121 RepID=UPI0006ECACFD|nr:translation initiation factor IF-2 [Leptolyngbya sp. NIES-2104]GAP97550.1 translation initiation factor 2 [Leptolyngbya sp. NIES-2104]